MNLKYNSPVAAPVKSDILLRIQEAEAESHRKQADAEAQAKQIEADARRQADAIVAEGKQQADFAYQSRIDAAKENAEADAKSVAASGDKKAAELRKRFESGVTGAGTRAVKILEGRL